MNRRRFLATLGSLALGACLGVQRVVPLAGRVEAERDDVWRRLEAAWAKLPERRIGVDLGHPGGDATVYYICTQTSDGRYEVGDIITVAATPSG